MAKARTGSRPKWDPTKGCWVGRLTLDDGSRPWVTCDGLPNNERGRLRAAELIRERAEVAQRKGLRSEHFELRSRKASAPGSSTNAPAPPQGETCDDWYKRFIEHRKTEVASVDDDKWRWNRWISPRIGPKPIRDVTPDHVEDIRDALNAAIVEYEKAGCVTGEGRLAHKTARNVWSCLTTAFKYASTRKGPRELRVREDKGNPCLGIPPPRDGASKRRHWLRPPEVTAVLACKDVPIEWREAIAIGCYLHLRPGELHELRAKDVDLSVGEVAIRRAFDERTGTVKKTKTDEGVRTVTIPDSLLPLLKRMKEEREANDRLAGVVSNTPEKSRAGIFRTFLEKAKVKRAELFEETETHLQIDFRSLRDSGITWRFLAEHRSEVVQREAGHEHISTTLGYAKEVQNKQGRYGQPFPPLPPDLVKPNPPESSGESSGGSGNPGKTGRKGSGRRDLNPRQRAPKARALPDCATPRWNRGQPSTARGGDQRGRDDACGGDALHVARGANGGASIRS